MSFSVSLPAHDVCYCSALVFGLLMSMRGIDDATKQETVPVAVLCGLEATKQKLEQGAVLCGFGEATKQKKCDVNRTL